MAAKTTTPAPRRSSKLTLGFGLVNVPVAMKPLNETQRSVPGKNMCPTHGPTINQRNVCCVGTADEHVLEYAELVKGYPHPDDPKQFVEVDPSVIEEIAESGNGMAKIERIVDATTIDAAYFDKVYLCWPQEGGEAAFDLIAAVLRSEGRAAVTTTVLSKQTRMVVFRWSEEFGCLLAHVCRFGTELRQADVGLVKLGAGARTEPTTAQFDAARTLLHTLSGEFDPAEVEDTWTTMMQDAIRAAAGGKTFTPAKAQAVDSSSDLMASLMASLEAAPKPKGRKVAA